MIDILNVYVCDIWSGVCYLVGRFRRRRRVRFVVFVVGEIVLVFFDVNDCVYDDYGELKNVNGVVFVLDCGWLYG